MKRLVTTILIIFIIGGIGFSGYKLNKYKEKEVSEVEIVLFSAPIVLSLIHI